MDDFDFDKGQHFLIDENILKREILEAKLKKKDKIIEIGAGTGKLTEKLAEESGKVLAFEIDERFKDKLISLGMKYKNLTIIFDNALNYSWKVYGKIVSNIPYYLSEEVINKAIKEDIKELILIIGENFKKLLFSDSKIGLIAEKFYKIEEIIDIPRESFEPMPRVDSVLIKLEKKNKINYLDRIILDIAFGEGKVKNSIVRALNKTGKTKRQAKYIIDKLRLDEKILNKPAKMITAKLLLRIEEGLKLIAEDL